MSSIGGVGGGWPLPGGAANTIRTSQLDRGASVGGSEAAGGTQAPPTFDKLLNQFIDGVEETQKASELEARKVLLGQSDNLHQAMLASEESKIALQLLVEVRNKLVEGFQEVMRMQV